MTIERLGSVDPVTKINKTNKTNAVEKPVSKGSIDISQEARKSAALQQAMNTIRAVPDIRMDRVNEVAEKLKDPNYINDAVVEAVADKLLGPLGL